MIIPIIFGILILIGAIFSLYHLGKAANTFFREADRIEKMIRENAIKEDVVKSLYALKNKSFHARTGERIRELAKMAEVKYNIKILKP